ncbi:hypothetical protein HFN53_07650 [Rhizobium leguminosarum]|uniref:hypothetical protein n=1 Tax=Rhizobium ruizarguesonis TaxID=2081791 RepID=UPI001030B772|nr:hypothetical protein [Rhizobium ruizarguesonis]MBY5871891.1 hypothetical protein [Rhizobium leguminosarum]TBC69491.1 hypothetical protein ELH30_30085 [Rhizobium ruizarguesonis]
MSDYLEYPFRIIGPKPDTIPMVRLAFYMAELAKLMGSPEHVHFKEVLDKSVSIVACADAQLVAVISPRIREAAHIDNDAEAAAPWRKINEGLAEDGWTAELPLPKGGEVISFPGKVKASKAIRSVTQHTAVQGRLIRLEGAGDLVKIGLEIDGDLSAAGISLSATVAIELAHRFHQFVRLSGEGKWSRNTDGKWALDNLKATSFEVLEDVPLDETLGKLKGLLAPGSAEAIIKNVDELRRA